MTRAEAIRQMDEFEMYGYLCALTKSTCEDCYFEKDAKGECGAIMYLRGNVNEKYDLLVEVGNDRRDP